MKRLFILLVFIAPIHALSQNDTIEIRKVIDIFFHSLKVGDSAQMATILHDNISLGTTFNTQAGVPAYQVETKQELLDAVGTPHIELWNEKISNVAIYCDDNLATAWMDYNFYLNDTFSHCGVNSFGFIKTEKGWMIISIIDTRRKEPCEKAINENH